MRMTTLAVATLLASCGSPSSGRGEDKAAATVARTDNEAHPDNHAGTVPLERTARRPATPVSLVRAYYAAIGAGDYARAYRLWRDDGKASGKSLAEFARGFADTAETMVDPGTPSAPEGAAGSVYVTLPVIVSATTRAGTHQTFKGHYVVRRANSVPGAFSRDRDWRIDSAALKAAH